MMTPNEILKTAKEALDKALAERKQNQELIKSLGPAIIDALKPILNEIAANSKIPKEEILRAVSQIKIPDIKIPEPNISVNVPDIRVPEIRVPKSEFHFDASKIRFPDIKMPGEMEIKGWVNLMGYDRGLLSNPLPVQLRDAKGNPISLFENMTQILNGGGGGKTDFFTIKGFNSSAFSEITNPDGRLKVELPSGSSGLTDTELRAAHLDVQQVSGAIDSVYVTGIFNSTTADVINPDNRIRVSVETGGSGLTDAELRASPLQTQQVSGYADSVNVISTVGLTDAQLRASTLDVKQVSGAVHSVVVNDVLVSVPVFQVSGAINSVNVVQVTGQTPSLNAGDADAGTFRIIIAKSANATTAAVSVGADASTNIALTNLNRKSIAITHQSTSTLYIATGTAASTTSMPVLANQIVGFDDYTGPVNAIAEEQAGTILVRYIEII